MEGKKNIGVGDVLADNGSTVIINTGKMLGLNEEQIKKLLSSLQEKMSSQFEQLRLDENESQRVIIDYLSNVARSSDFINLREQQAANSEKIIEYIQAIAGEQTKSLSDVVAQAVDKLQQSINNNFEQAKIAELGIKKELEKSVIVLLKEIKIAQNTNINEYIGQIISLLQGQVSTIAQAKSELREINNLHYKLERIARIREDELNSQLLSLKDRILEIKKYSSQTYFSTQSIKSTVELTSEEIRIMNATINEMQKAIKILMANQNCSQKESYIVQGTNEPASINAANAAIECETITEINEEFEKAREQIGEKNHQEFDFDAFIERLSGLISTQQDEQKQIKTVLNNAIYSKNSHVDSSISVCPYCMAKSSFIQYVEKNGVQTVVCDACKQQPYKIDDPQKIKDWQEQHTAIVQELNGSYKLLFKRGASGTMIIPESMDITSLQNVVVDNNSWAKLKCLVLNSKIRRVGREHSSVQPLKKCYLLERFVVPYVDSSYNKIFSNVTVYEKSNL